jgi:phosphatidylglycerophosphate synthase
LIGEKYGHFLDKPLGRFFKNSPVPPNTITLIGFGATTLAALVLSYHLFWGGVLVLLGSLFDMLDGIVARVNGRTTAFGAYLDSVLDRYSDGFLFLGLAYNLREYPTGIALSLGTLLGAFLVSYARARAEGLGEDCKVGIMERPERIILLALGALSGLIVHALWIMFVLTQFTVLQRIFYTKKTLSGK